MTKSVMIIAGEASGDKHAAYLVDSLKRKSDCRVFGIGGDKMSASGVELLHHIREMSVMGFTGIFSKLPFLRRVRRDLVDSIRSEKPSAVILVDYPGFNLRFADIAKRQGIKVIYFISPQVWAWGKRRIVKIRQTVDLMLTIFKFEEEMYNKEGVDAHFVGHPLLDEMVKYRHSDIDDFRNVHDATGGARLLALFPGSRLQEVSRILPTMLESVELLRDELSSQGMSLSVAIGCFPGIDKEVYEKIVRNSGVNVHLTDDSGLLMSSADAGMVKSGTSTLEAALYDLPMTVVYKTSWLNYLIGRLLVKLDSISLVNIVAGRKIVEELVQDEFTPLKASRILRGILTDQEMVADIRLKYSRLREILGGPGASDRAAELILRAI